VATVSTSGLVTSVGIGGTTITVTTADGGHAATCAVTVTRPVCVFDFAFLWDQGCGFK